MFRVTSIDGDGSAVLRLEGRLADEWVGELSRAVGESLEKSDALTLELGGLTFVDASGARLLRRLADSGVAMTGGSPFVVTLIAESTHDIAH